MSVTVRPFRRGDEPAVVALLTSVFAGWPRRLPGADPAAAFRWKHLDSPFGQSVMVVAEDGGELVGFEALLRWPFGSGAGTVQTMRGVDLAVAGTHRGQGVAKALIGAATEEIAGTAQLVFSNPNTASDPLLVKQGRRPVGPFEVLVRPRRPLRMLRARRAQRRPDPPRLDRAEPAAAALADDGQLAQLLARRSAPDGRLATALDPRYLRWRYGEVGDYSAVALRGDGGLDGLALFRLVPRAATWAVALCELLAAGDDPRRLRELLGRVRTAAPADFAVCHFPPASPARRAAQRGGFVRLPRGQRLMVNPLHDDLAPDPTVTASWALSYGDLELL